MRDETWTEPRRTLARNGIIILLIWLGLHIFFQNHDAQTPSVAAAADVSTRVGVTTSPVTNPTTPVILVRFEWLNRCQPSSGQLGFYAANDAPCHPSRIASLPWLQSQMVAGGLLTSNEYLDQAPYSTNPACAVIVLTSPSTPVGWICSDANGLYRTDITGQDRGSRVQLKG
jgi:hypothetical protein